MCHLLIKDLNIYDITMARGSATGSGKFCIVVNVTSGASHVRLWVNRSRLYSDCREKIEPLI
jgi:hypothetical protein